MAEACDGYRDGCIGVEHILFVNYLSLISHYNTRKEEPALVTMAITKLSSVFALLYSLWRRIISTPAWKILLSCFQHPPDQSIHYMLDELIQLFP